METGKDEQVDVEMVGQKALAAGRSYFQNKDQKFGFLSALFFFFLQNFHLNREFNSIPSKPDQN